MWWSSDGPKHIKNITDDTECTKHFYNHFKTEVMETINTLQKLTRIRSIHSMYLIIPVDNITETSQWLRLSSRLLEILPRHHRDQYKIRGDNTHHSLTPE